MLIKPTLLAVQNGLPDLTVNVVAAKSSILYGGTPSESSLVTIAVQNRLSIVPGPIVRGKQLLKMYGSAATNVMVLILLSSYLQQVGGVSVPAGFQSAASQNSLYFFGGSIPAGASVDFLIEVIAKQEVSTWATIWAQVDPYAYIQELSKSNNWGSASIYITSVN